MQDLQAPARALLNLGALVRLRLTKLQQTALQHPPAPLTQAPMQVQQLLRELLAPQQHQYQQD